MSIRTRQQKIMPKTLIFLFLALSLFLISTSVTFAVDVSPEYQPLVGIPGLTNLKTDTPLSLPEYINQIYLLTIVVGSLLGVMRLAWAGVKYSLSDNAGKKDSAKHDMQGVLMGLAILLIPFIVLKEINPDLINLDVFHEVRNFKISGNPTARTFVCETAECQANCVAGTNRKGKIILKNEKSVCDYDEIRNFAPQLAITSKEMTNTYIDCLQQGGTFDFNSDTCLPRISSNTGILSGFTCREWGGDYEAIGLFDDSKKRTCTSKITAVEVYPKGAHQVQDPANLIDLKATWKTKCGSSSELKTPDDGHYITFMCVKK